MTATFSRRRLLAVTAAAAGLTLTGAISRTSRAAADVGPALWLSAYATADAAPAYGVAAFDRNGRIAFACPLPGRAHGVTPHPDGGHAVVMARRPGRWFALLDLTSGKLTATVALPDDRRGTGHGVYDAAGRVFYMAEDNITRETGVLTRLDPANGYARGGEMPAGGVGPHQVIGLDNVRVLAVANGGVLTHPDTGRVKLNLEDMDPSLSYVDAASGQVLETARLPADFSNLGIRHLAALADGGVAFGMQDERPTGELQPLVGLHRRGQPPVLLNAPDSAWRRLAGYIGDIASDGRIIAAASPRGGVIGRWDSRDGAWLGLSELSDGCGLAPMEHAAGEHAANGPAGGFLATSGHGRIIALSGPDETPIADAAGYRWDNHLSPALAKG